MIERRPSVNPRPSDLSNFLRQGYEALHRGDLETFMALSRERLDPEFVFHSVWDGRVFKGLQGTREWISDTREVWENYDQKVEEIVDLGENVVVVVRIAGRGGGSGVPVSQELAVVWTFERDKPCAHGHSHPEPMPSRPRGCRSRRAAATGSPDIALPQAQAAIARPTG